jgi:hypothetical protein
MNALWKVRIAILLGLLPFCIPAGATKWHVDASVSSPGDGRSWTTAFSGIQDGINAARTGDTVLVARGTYVENIHSVGLNITLQSTDPWDATVVANTILDGGQVGPVVIFLGTENETWVLAGFTIRNGYGHFGGKYGAGIYGGGTHATIRNNVIAQNRTPST